MILKITVAEVLNQWGISTLYAPFIVVFALMYGLLRKTKILGDNEKLYAIMAFVFAIYFVYNTRNVLFVQRFFALFFYELLFLLFFLVIISMFVPESRREGGGTAAKSFIIGMLGIGLFIAIWYGLTYSPKETMEIVVNTGFNILEFLFETGLIIPLIFFGLFLLLLGLFTTPAPQPSLKDKLKNFVEDLVKELEKGSKR